MGNGQKIQLMTQPDESDGQPCEPGERMYINGDERERALERCEDDTYKRQTELCVKLFNQLKSTLSPEQKEILFSYDEAIAVKERLIIYGI